MSVVRLQGIKHVMRKRKITTFLEALSSQLLSGSTGSHRVGIHNCIAGQSYTYPSTTYASCTAPELN